MVDLTPAPDPLPADPERRGLNVWLAVGLLLRVAVFFAALPFNADRHFEVIEFIAAHHALPTSNVIDQSYQPPLYYLLMLPLYLLGRGSAGPVHGASLALSCAALWLSRRAIAHPIVRAAVARPGARTLAFALLATLPTFAIYAGFVSNDALAYPVGALTFLAVLAYVARPTRGRRLALAAIVGVGLLTKGTLLLSGVALAPVVLRVERGRGVAWRTAIGRVALFCALWAAIGCYKYVENEVRLGRPIVHNQDNENPTSLMQRNVWHGWRTAADVDVTQLIRRPVIRAYDPPAYPLLMYGTFWSLYIPEWSFQGNLEGWDRIGSLTYAVAIVPTLTFALGCAVVVAGLRRCDAASVAKAAALALFAANLFVVLAAGAKYANWSAFQSRLLFAQAAPIAVLFGVGLGRLGRWPARLATLAGWPTVGCGLLYLAVEFALKLNLLAHDEPIQWW